MDFILSAGMVSVQPGVNILQQNRKLFPDKNDQKWVTFPNLLSKLSKKGKLFPDGYPQIM